MISLDLEARVLICDPDNKITPLFTIILYGRFGGKKFGEGKPPHLMSTSVMHGFGQFEIYGVEFTIVNDLDSVVEHVKSKLPPYYSLVVYESEQMKVLGSAGKIADVNKHDFFIPQMIFGKGLESRLVGHCARAGALYFAEQPEDVYDQIGKIFKKPTRLPKLTIVKLGGSSYDFDRQSKTNLNLDYVCDTLVNIHQERHKSPTKRRVNRIIVTVGTGQYGDIVKEHTAKYAHHPRVTANYPKAMAQALQSNLENLKQHFGDRASLLKTGAFFYIDLSSTSKKIPLLGTAPHYIMVRDGIPLQDSDTHTIALAEFYQAERIVLIKRTDGIYDFDPYRGYPLGIGLTENKIDREHWKYIQHYNKRHEKVSVEDLLSSKLSREGTGRDGTADGSTGHLMEDSALRYMLEKCQHVKEILVVHIAPEEMHYPVGNNQYKHIVTGETLYVDPKKGWKGILEDNIRAAFRGEANSKIVKN